MRMRVRSLNRYKNDKGFIFPLAIAYSLLTFVMLISSVSIYVSEKQYTSLMKDYYNCNSMLLLALKHIIDMVDDGKEVNHGVVQFSAGEVSYNIQKQQDNNIIISVQMKNSRNETLKSEMLYNLKNKQIMEWKE
ncbi:hypothetical protein NG54_12990 [Heyndrickxia ginsengihumi]|uniref:Uncharacterized protein n=2 Tax=Heyndrickxia ginsengihumi TaxID=363870 RepID=A0A0A6VBI9_9BACI|nr:hypothetical protein NG54_12990 [Heyndrickxia ginsengihumi]